MRRHLQASGSFEYSINQYIPFLAGADIKEMVPKEFSEVFGGGFLENWTQVSKVRKPVIAAVNGHALGGGCEVNTYKNGN